MSTVHVSQAIAAALVEMARKSRTATVHDPMGDPTLTGGSDPTATSDPMGEVTGNRRPEALRRQSDPTVTALGATGKVTPCRHKMPSLGEGA